MPHAGRPRRCSELSEIRGQIEENREDLVSKVRQFSEERRNQDAKEDRIARSRFDYAFVAACVLFTLENGTPAQKMGCGKWIDHLRNNTNYGAAVDPYGRMKDAEFLEAFILKCAPGWDWRKQTQDRSRAAHGESFIQELAQMLRDSRAHRKRYVLPERPDASRLIFLADRTGRNEPMTWATLKEIKLATALSERTIRQIIKCIQTKKSELVLKTPRRLDSRYRCLHQLVVELLQKAVQRDPNFALAYCELVKAQCGLYELIWDPKDLELAKKSAEAALRLRPDWARLI